MKAIVRSEYGPPEVLGLAEVPDPLPGDGEVRVRVRAAAVCKGDWEILRGEPLWVRLSGFGLLRPKARILGYDLAGVVEATGPGVTRFAVGDEVCANVLMTGLGAFAELACVPQDGPIARKPAGLSFEDAASVVESGLIALQGLRDEGRLEAGQRVLINGAGGGAGSFAIQLAKSLGAEVTGVDRAEKRDWMRSLGADLALDLAADDLGGTYDVILDVVGARTIGTWRRALRPGGTYLAVGGSVGWIAKTLLAGAWTSLTGDRSVGMLALRPCAEDLATVLELVESGRVSATVDRCYPLAEVPDALRHLGAGRAQGRLVVTP